jgi:hypothetical protein
MKGLRDPSRLHLQYRPLPILYIVYSQGNAVRKREIQETGQVDEASDLANAFSDLTDRQPDVDLQNMRELRSIRSDQGINFRECVIIHETFEHSNSTTGRTNVIGISNVAHI